MKYMNQHLKKLKRKEQNRTYYIKTRVTAYMPRLWKHGTHHAYFVKRCRCIICIDGYKNWLDKTRVARKLYMKQYYEKRSTSPVAETNVM